MSDVIEHHHDDQAMQRLIGALEEYLEKAVIALIISDRDGKLSIVGPAELPVVHQLRDALRERGIGWLDAERNFAKGRKSEISGGDHD